MPGFFLRSLLGCARLMGGSLQYPVCYWCSTSERSGSNTRRRIGRRHGLRHRQLLAAFCRSTRQRSRSAAQVRGKALIVCTPWTACANTRYLLSQVCLVRRVDPSFQSAESARNERPHSALRVHETHIKTRKAAQSAFNARRWASRKATTMPQQNLMPTARPAYRVRSIITRTIRSVDLPKMRKRDRHVVLNALEARFDVSIAMPRRHLLLEKSTKPESSFTMNASWLLWDLSRPRATIKTRPFRTTLLRTTTRSWSPTSRTLLRMISRSISTLSLWTGFAKPRSLRRCCFLKLGQSRCSLQERWSVLHSCSCKWSWHRSCGAATTC